MKSAIVIGAGIVGLATARALALKGFKVTVIERSGKAAGASVRNFGMIWPIGQPDGILYDRALRSREIWKEIAATTGFSCQEYGSLHLAYHSDEWQVLEELYEIFLTNGRRVSLQKPAEILRGIQGVNPTNLSGGLFSETEMVVDPREAIGLLPAYLGEVMGVQFIWNKCVTKVERHSAWLGKELLHADIIFSCTGADLELLFPDNLAGDKIIKCKLQMMRFLSSESHFKIGIALCAGLSLVHYDSFKVAPSLASLKNRYENEMSDYLAKGIHVMVAQNGQGELTVGDSHEYGQNFEPFDNVLVNDMILNYLRSFVLIDHWQMIQSWHGIYAKMTDHTKNIFLQIDEGVYVINGLGGAGMTLSFGLAEEVVESVY